MGRKGFFTVLCFFLLFFVAKPLMAEPLPSINGKGAVLIDQESGQVLFEKAKDEKLPPASITKILTAIIAIESGKLDETVLIGSNPPRLDGTKVYLEEGEKVRLKDLVRAALVHSANDAALAIAEYLGGSETKFVEIMNTKARELGAQNSNFVNSHGLIADNHYTTAYDIALITRYAMKNPIFRENVKTKVLDWQGQAWQTRLINKNELLWSYQGATGVKTGYTTEAKCTIVASATRGEQSYIAAVLGSQGNSTWTDAENLLDFGFNNFQSLQLAGVGEVVATVNIAEDKQLLLGSDKDLTISLPQQGNKKVDSRILLQPLGKTVEKGQNIGKVIFTIDGREVGTVGLVAQNQVKVSEWRLFDVLVYVCAGLFLLQILWRFYQMSRNRKRNYFRMSRNISRGRYF